jgi:hypothetical protein
MATEVAQAWIEVRAEPGGRLAMSDEIQRRHSQVSPLGRRLLWLRGSKARAPS